VLGLDQGFLLSTKNSAYFFASSSSIRQIDEAGGAVATFD
jgi:hypothetical protein